MFDSWIPISVIIHSPSCHQSCNHGNGMSTVQIRTSIMGSQRFTSIFHWAISPPFRWQSWESRWPKHRSHRLKASSGWATESFWRQLERARRGKDQTDQQRCDFKCSSPTATESHNWVLFTFYFLFFFRTSTKMVNIWWDTTGYTMLYTSSKKIDVGAESPIHVVQIPILWTQWTQPSQLVSCDIASRADENLKTSVAPSNVKGDTSLTQSFPMGGCFVRILWNMIL